MLCHHVNYIFAFSYVLEPRPPPLCLRQNALNYYTSLSLHNTRQHVTHTYGYRQKGSHNVTQRYTFTFPIVLFRVRANALPFLTLSHIHISPLSPHFHTNVHKSVIFHINSLVFYLFYYTLFITL